MAAFMQRLQHSRIYPQLLRALRVLQFLSALVSIILFSLRVRRLLRLYHELNRATGAVEGILAAAVLYTIFATAITFLLKGRGGSILRWLLVALDIAFVGAFIAAAVLTSPKNGSGGLGCYGSRKRIASQNNYVDDPYCQLPLGTFITAIVSTILHALTAIFHSARDHHREHKENKIMKGSRYSGETATYDGPIGDTHHVDTRNAVHNNNTHLGHTGAQQSKLNSNNNFGGNAV